MKLLTGLKCRVQESYRHHANIVGVIERIELQANALFDDIYIRTDAGDLIKTARHLVHPVKPAALIDGMFDRKAGIANKFSGKTSVSLGSTLYRDLYESGYNSATA